MSENGYVAVPREEGVNGTLMVNGDGRPLLGETGHKSSCSHSQKGSPNPSNRDAESQGKHDYISDCFV